MLDRDIDQLIKWVKFGVLLLDRNKKFRWSTVQAWLTDVVLISVQVGAAALSRQRQGTAGMTGRRES